ncbi:DUF2460 domain-containing protein [Candidatus Macondimonas diazotrophica]|jgi:uncharacterized protein (TIGR02217 family)|uniref:TIGR02217 family protein n=1 Tax=Candidatus Macondimonas diazotrophica TaxID=2305248 RepID=A0A4Z0F6J4_9GAMM|nr:DUF2460 domain-containing protein [Candidatus Macondimonas diazotrophica]TFZ81584.1 TIGR02217 family protein [Candidatus Macondimonas diazotrophica]
MSFHNVRLPTQISYGSLGGPGFKTSVITAGSGKEQRNQEWARSRAEYDLKYGIQTEEEMHAVIKFFYARRARAYSFRFKDWGDYKVVEQNIGILSDGGEEEFQLFKRYEDDASTYDRVLSKIVDGTVLGVKKNGVELDPEDWSLDYDTGIFTFTGSGTGGDVISIDYFEFDVPVRFDIDSLPVSWDNFNQNSISSIPVIEVHPDEEVVT